MRSAEVIKIKGKTKKTATKAQRLKEAQSATKRFFIPNVALLFIG